MFKALDTQTGNDIVILDPRWIQQIDALRRLDHANLLVCQGCRQPVRVRVGSGKRRRHFAHKHLHNCAYGNESPILLQARAALYERLVAVFGAAVTLEKRIEDPAFRRPVDCWVERPEGGAFAYWIFDTGMRLQAREDLHAGMKRAAVANVHWLFTANVLRPHENNQRVLHLCTTERDFLRPTFFDVDMADEEFTQGRSLHYLDSEIGTLTTFRSLNLIHEPQVFAARRRLTSRLADALVSAKTGEFAHAGEREHVAAVLHEKARVERLQQERAAADLLRVAREQEAMMLARVRAGAPGFAVASPSSWSPATDPLPEPRNPVPVLQEREGVCLLCGTRTRDWWIFNGKDGTCQCKTCRQKGVIEGPTATKSLSK